MLKNKFMFRNVENVTVWDFFIMSIHGTGSRLYLKVYFKFSAVIGKDKFGGRGYDKV